MILIRKCLLTTQLVVGSDIWELVLIVRGLGGLNVVQNGQMIVV